MYLENTVGIIALIKVDRTVYMSTGFWFVRFVFAVGSSITIPGFWQAYSRRLTLELFVRVALVWWNRC